VYQQHDGGESNLNETALRLHIDLTVLIDRSNGYSRSEIVRLIEERQEKLILEICSLSILGATLKEGWRLHQNPSNQPRNNQVQGEEDERERRRDVRMKLAEFASKMNYNDSRLEELKSSINKNSSRT